MLAYRVSPTIKGIPILLAASTACSTGQSSGSGGAGGLAVAALPLACPFPLAFLSSLMHTGPISGSPFSHCTQPFRGLVDQ
jgi:hypothetical protein